MRVIINILFPEIAKNNVSHNFFFLRKIHYGKTTLYNFFPYILFSQVIDISLLRGKRIMVVKCWLSKFAY